MLPHLVVTDKPVAIQGSQDFTGKRTDIWKNPKLEGKTFLLYSFTRANRETAG